MKLNGTVIVAAIVALVAIAVAAITVTVFAPSSTNVTAILGIITAVIAPTIVSFLALLKADQNSQQLTNVHHDLVNGGLKKPVIEAVTQVLDEQQLVRQELVGKEKP